MTLRNAQRTRLLDRIAYANPRETPDPRDILNSLGAVVYDWDLASDRLRWGPNVEQVLGFTSATRIDAGSAYVDRIGPENGISPHEAIMRSSETDKGSGVRYQIHYGLMPYPGSPSRTWVEDSGRWFSGPNGQPARAHGVIRVINRCDAAHDGPRPAVHHDCLTGALSRSRFIELTKRIFSESSRNEARCSLMLAAIDGLSTINQAYGYGVADQVIAGTAQRFQRVLRANDLVGRYAGNKFAIVMPVCDEEQLERAAKRCLDEVGGEPIATDAGPMSAKLRIGGVVAPLHAASHHSVFLHAEEALDAARTPSGSHFVAYDPAFAHESGRHQTRKLSEQIVAALNDRRISIAIEPIVDATSRRIAFQEALMRMRLENGRVIPPAVVFSTAEKAGLAPLLDQRVLELALERLAADPSLSLSVNMSGATSREADWPDRARATLQRYPQCLDRLIVEITETCAIEDIEATRRAINLLKGMGIRVAMDDFGAGHTSFRNLRALQLDLVKIDGAFVQNLARSPDDRFFVRTLIELARHIGIPTVAEWVEDEETARLLREWGVTYLQGRLFGLAGDADPEESELPRRRTEAA